MTPDPLSTRGQLPRSTKEIALPETDPEGPQGLQLGVGLHALGDQGATAFGRHRHQRPDQGPTGRVAVDPADPVAVKLDEGRTELSTMVRLS